jgi:hypothetical protein
LAEPHRNKARRSQPISRHPLFPAIVALWFAVLLGLGSLAISPSALEALVRAGHVGLLIPAAAPPLGMTARLLVSLALTLAGAGIGWVLARRMTAPAKPAPQVLKVADVDDAEPLPWPGMAEKPAPAPDSVSFAPELRKAEPALEAEPNEAEPNEAETAPRAPTAAERIATAELDSLSHVELVERLAIALQRRQERQGAAEAAFAPSEAVVRFPGFADRHGARLQPPTPAPRPAPEQTEKALREALAALQRMSGSA